MDVQAFTQAAKNEMLAQLNCNQLPATYGKGCSKPVSEICKDHDEMPLSSHSTEDSVKDNSHDRRDCFQARSKRKNITQTESLNYYVQAFQNNEPDYGHPYLCASNLPTDVTAKKVKRHFNADDFVRFYPDIGFAQLHYKAVESAIKALRFNGSIWRQHLIRLDWFGNCPNRTIFTGFDISPKVKKIRRSLAAHFSCCGAIKRLSILTFRRRQSAPPAKKAVYATGKAFLEFESHESFIKGILLDQSNMDGFELQVRVAQRKLVRHKKAKPSLWQGTSKVLDVETTLTDLWEGKRTVYSDSD